jgi:RNA methyltransferase, TrmH family
MFRAEVITSPRNPILQEVRRAVKRGTLTPDGLCVAATFHLLEEGLRSACLVPFVLAGRSVTPLVEKHIRGLKDTRLLVMDDSLLAAVAGTESPQGVVALVQPPVWTLDHAFRGRPLVVILDGVQDPGNAGALMRAAEAFGATGVLFAKGSVTPYHPKTVRASAGSLFRLPCIGGMDAELIRAACVQRRLDIFAAVSRHGRPLDEIDMTRKCALVIGSEGHGVGATLSGSAIEISIPTSGVESLNAAAAGAILLYEAARQRRQPLP